MRHSEQQKLWDYIKNIKVGMMVNQDQEFLRGRPMQVLQQEFDGTLYFLSDIGSHKHLELHQNTEVCVIFSCPEKSIYVSTSGQISYSDDVAQKETLLKQVHSIKQQIIKVPSDPEKVIIISIPIEQAEYWDAPSNKMVALYKKVKNEITENKEPMVEHKKVQ